MRWENFKEDHNSWQDFNTFYEDVPANVQNYVKTTQDKKMKQEPQQLMKKINSGQEEALRF